MKQFKSIAMLVGILLCSVFSYSQALHQQPISTEKSTFMEGQRAFTPVLQETYFGRDNNNPNTGQVILYYDVQWPSGTVVNANVSYYIGQCCHQPDLEYTYTFGCTYSGPSAGGVWQMYSGEIADAVPNGPIHGYTLNWVTTSP